MCGITIIGCLLLTFFLPVPLTSIIPGFFFGGVLCFIAVSLLREWLWDSRNRCSRSEYAVVWVTFAAVNFVNIELGMLVGVLFQIFWIHHHAKETFFFFRVNQTMVTLSRMASVQKAALECFFLNSPFS